MTSGLRESSATEKVVFTLDGTDALICGSLHSPGVLPHGVISRMVKDGEKKGQNYSECGWNTQMEVRGVIVSFDPDTTNEYRGFERPVLRIDQVTSCN
jgi:hypothetical protein